MDRSQSTIPLRCTLKSVSLPQARQYEGLFISGPGNNCQSALPDRRANQPLWKHFNPKSLRRFPLSRTAVPPPPPNPNQITHIESHGNRSLSVMSGSPKSRFHHFNCLRPSDGFDLVGQSPGMPGGLNRCSKSKGRVNSRSSRNRREELYGFRKRCVSLRHYHLPQN
jgi:hypothetical protein